MCQCGDNVKVSLLVWCTRYTDTFCNAVDCGFELALEVQIWTRARSECLPGGRGAKIIVTPLQEMCKSGVSAYWPLSLLSVLFIVFHIMLCMSALTPLLQKAAFASQSVFVM